MICANDVRHIRLGQRPLSWWAEQPGNYLDDRGDLWFGGRSLPVLLLAASLPQGVKPRPGREWLNIAHQGAGFGCNTHRFFATVLTPRQAALDGLRALADEWFYSTVGMFGVGLSEFNAYRASLRRHLGESVDCDFSFSLFEEGVYPIDCSNEALACLCEDALPANLGDLLDFGDDTRSGIRRFIGCLGRWQLVALGENCD